MVTILNGDCREVLKTLPDASVNCCVTSPPYWGLRDYGHTAQIGLERTPEEYVASLVAVFRQVRRAMRDDGTLWLNMGDSYTGYWGKKYAHKPFGEDRTPDASTPPHKDTPDWWAMGLKPKELVGIPWRVAFALQADGWWLRSDIIWHKPNPMPESVTDRPTKSHEYIFLLTKSDRYYYDAEAIKEPTADPAREKRCEGENAYRGQAAIRPRGATRRHRKPAGWDTGTGAHGAFHREGRAQEVEYTETEATNRNKRDVWTVPTAPYSGAHFATFPPALITPCILAGCPQGGTVLDPFGGSGTTGEVSEANGRNSVLIELNEQYIELAKRRTAQAGLFCRHEGVITQ